MDTICKVSGCVRAIQVKRDQLCAAHYARFRKYGSPTGGEDHYVSPDGICIVEGCGRAHCARGLCAPHYKKRARYGDSMMPPPLRSARGCTVPECDRPYRAAGYCSTHYQRWRYNGDPMVTAADVRRAANGGTLAKRYREVSNGSILVNGVRHRRRKLAHRAVMEQILGRALFPGENVHHRNGDRFDNRPENLELWVKSQPAGQRVSDLVDWARTIIERYGGVVDAEIPRSPTDRHRD